MPRHVTAISFYIACATVVVLMNQNCSGGSSNGSTPVTKTCAADETLTQYNTCELTAPVSNVTPTFTRTDFMTGLSSPWDMAFMPDGLMFFTERCRGLSVRQTNGTVNRLFGTAGSALVAPDLFCEGQSGVHGIAIDPNFASNRYVYVYMASNLSTNPRTNRVVRLTISSNFTSASNRLDIVTSIPYKDVGNAVGGAGAHSGGRVRFGPDGFLYVTTGDNHNSVLPQGLSNLGAKVLRLQRDGSAAPGNGTPSGGDARIYTFGHRNPQGISFRPISGQPYTSEHGPGHTDEVTPLVAGGNGGWDPRPETGVTCPDNYCGYTTNKTNGTPTPMTDTPKFPGAMQPAWANGGSSQGMGPAEFLRGRNWKAWHGRLAVGIMGAQRLDILTLDAGGIATASTTPSLPAARMRSVVLGPDGSLYVATDAGAIWKITPQ